MAPVGASSLFASAVLRACRVLGSVLDLGTAGSGQTQPLPSWSPLSSVGAGEAARTRDVSGGGERGGRGSEQPRNHGVGHVTEHGEGGTRAQHHSAEWSPALALSPRACVPNHCRILPALPRALAGHSVRKQGGDGNFP